MKAISAIVIMLAVASGAAFGQTSVPFGGLSHDSSQQVEIAADNLTVSQTDGRAVFEGNVRVGQGTLRLAASRISVVYGSSGVTGQVERMEASGSVTLTNGSEAAEAESAIYDVASGRVTMTGDVLLTQGANALSGDSLVIDLNTGTAQMQGRVQTVLQPTSEP